MSFMLMPLPQAAADTVVMLQARDGLATAALVANLVLTTVFVLILVALVFLLFQLRGIQRTVKELTGRLEKRVDPILERGREVAANVEFISGAVRADVQRVSDSVRSLSDRLQGASDRMEQRVEEFNALMEVVQSEAEDVFIGSAATMRGLRAGARALGRRRAEPDSIDEDDDELAVEIETQLPPNAAPSGAPATGKVSGAVETDAAVRRSGGG